MATKRRVLALTQSQRADEMRQAEGGLVRLRRYVRAENCLATSNPSLAAQWHPKNNGGLTPEGIAAGSSRKAWWICPLGHEWQATVHSRNRGSGCPKCRSSSSLTELRFLAELRWVFKRVVHRSKHGGFECDLFLPRYSLGVEYDGLRWHSEKATADEAKNIALKNQGIECVRVRQQGLPKIGVHDVIVEKKAAHTVNAVKSLLSAICSIRTLSRKDEARVAEYLGLHSWANDAEYQRLLANHPYPLLGLSLSDKFPAVARSWHPTKNAALSPRHVYPQSGLKVWWTCEKGHEWKANIAHRAKGSGCPVCSGARAIPATSLQALFPSIAAQWNHQRNAQLLPTEVRPRSGRKVWWRCQSGHEWLAVIASRVNGNGCPYCSGKRPAAGLPRLADRTLAVLRVDLAKEWHNARNGTMKPSDVSAGSAEKVWWQCDKGHEWQATVTNRARGAGCPMCSGRVASPENNLAIRFPEIAVEWHPAKNGDMTPADLSPGSHKKVWWKCKKGHEWQAPPKTRLRGSGCPYCAGRKVASSNCLEIRLPELAVQWHPTKNHPQSPATVTCGSGKIVWWLCPKGHEWRAAVCHRAKNGSGCPLCANRKACPENSLASRHPDIARQWHQSKNGTLTALGVTPGSTKRVWWVCPAGHEWEATVGHRVAGRGCPVCAGKKVIHQKSLANLFPHLALQWHPLKNGLLKPQKVSPGSAKSAWWICPCGHEWQTRIVHRRNGSGCPVCARKRLTH